jgi:hypothetical protein
VEHLEVVADRADRQAGRSGELPDVRRTVDAEQLGEPTPERVVEGDQELGELVGRARLRAGKGRGVQVALCCGTSGQALSVAASPGNVHEPL